MADPCDFVIFRCTGDLAVRTLLPALYLRDIHSPLPSTRFCPTGGITPTNVAEYLKTPNVGCVGGSWLTPADAIDRHDWAKISSAVAAKLAKAASAAPSS